MTRILSACARLSLTVELYADRWRRRRAQGSDWPTSDQWRLAGGWA